MIALDQMVLKTLAPEGPGFSISLKGFQVYEAIKTLDINTKDSIFKKVLELDKEDEVSCFIRNDQGHLIYLCDCIKGYRDKCKAFHKSPAYPVYTQLLEQVSDQVAYLLNFLNTYFTAYFDMDKETPIAVREKAKERFALKIMEISQFVVFIHDKLLKAVLLPAFEFQNDGPENVATYRRIMYLEILLNEFTGVLKAGGDLQEALKWKLVCLNFNSLLF